MPTVSQVSTAPSVDKELDTNARQAAKELSCAGFAMHWLHPLEKRPIGDRWSEAPVLSAAELLASHRACNNLGVRLGKPSQVAGGYLHVIDVDIRLAELAEEAWALLRDLFPDIDISELPEVQSGSGGESRHLYLITDKPFRSKRLAVSPGKHKRVKDGREGWSYDYEIELFGTGKQVAMPPSIHPESGRPYVWLREFDLAVLDLGIGPFVPSDAIERLAVSEHATYEFETREPLRFTGDQLQRTLSAINVSELHYDDWIRLGQALHHQFGGGEQGFALWLEHTRRSSKFAGEKQVREMRRTKWKSFGRYRGPPVTMATVKAWATVERDRERTEYLRDAFDEEPEDLAGTAVLTGSGAAADSDPIDAIGSAEPASEAVALGWVAKLNRRHAVAFVQGKTVILSEQGDGGVAYGSPTDLHNFYENRRVPTDRGGSRAITRAWMEHKNRKSYPNGIVFAPAGGPAGAYNHWKGFAVEPDAASNCPLFLAHLRDVICSGDDTAAAWVLRWFAHMIQRPGEKPGTALVLRGRKGAGKDTIGEYVGSLFPRHHTKIVNAEHLHGRFNAHQERTLMLHVEEGFWAGDHKAEASLKSLITSEQVQIERKGIDAFQVASVLRVFISSNSEWVVPASFDERRFCVLDVSPHRAGDAAYFAALREEMEGGGPAALLHHLQSLDLTGFNVRKPPMTEGLREQKLQSLKNVERWWFEVLQAGDLPGAHGGFDDDGPTWETPLSASRDGLRSSYREWLKDRRFDGAALDQRAFGKRLRNLCPNIQDGRIGGRAARTRVHTFPPIADCRRSFECVLGLHVDWEAESGD
jgi:hypothetical protein